MTGKRSGHIRQAHEDGSCILRPDDGGDVLAINVRTLRPQFLRDPDEHGFAVSFDLDTDHHGREHPVNISLLEQS